MVQAVYFDSVNSQYSSQLAVFSHLNWMGQEIVRFIRSMVMFQGLRALIPKVFVQAATQGHVDHLQPPANPKERRFASHHILQELNFKPVTILIDKIHPWVGLRCVVLGVYVTTTAEEHPIQAGYPLI